MQNQRRFILYHRFPDSSLYFYLFHLEEESVMWNLWDNTWKTRLFSEALAVNNFLFPIQVLAKAQR